MVFESIVVNIQRHSHGTDLRYSCTGTNQVVYFISITFNFYGVQFDSSMLPKHLCNEYEIYFNGTNHANDNYNF